MEGKKRKNSRESKAPKKQKVEAESSGDDGQTAASLTTVPLSEVVYSFSFFPRSNGSLLPSALLQEIWVSHILPLLKNKDMKTLRETCRGFFFLVSLAWKAKMDMKSLMWILRFLPESCPQWPLPIHRLTFGRSTHSAYDLQCLTRLRNLKEMNFFCYGRFLKDEHIKYFPSTLSTVEFFGCYHISNVGLQTLPSSLRKLDLSQCDQITDESLRYIPSSLVELKFENCTQISDLGLQYLPSTLTSLTLRKCPRITDSGLKDIPSSVLKLDLHQNSHLSDRGLQSLPPFLTELDLTKVTLLTDLGVRSLPSTLTKLTLFDCQRITKAGLQALSSNLYNLDLSWCTQLTSVDLKCLSSSIRVLSLWACKRVTDEAVKILPRRLVYLNLGFGPNVSDACLPFLPSTLTHLCLSNCNRITLDGLLQHLPASLRRVELQGAINEDEANRLKAAKPLLRIDMTGFHYFPDY